MRLGLPPPRSSFCEHVSPSAKLKRMRCFLLPAMRLDLPPPRSSFCEHVFPSAKLKRMRCFPLLATPSRSRRLSQLSYEICVFRATPMLRVTQRARPTGPRRLFCVSDAWPARQTPTAIQLVTATEQQNWMLLQGRLLTGMQEVCGT